MKTVTVCLLVITMIPAVATGAGDVVQEKVYDTDTSAVWAMRWSYGNEWAGPLLMAGRSEKGAESHLTTLAKKLCREEGWESFDFLQFGDIYAEDADPRLQLAWEHFGGSSQQSTFARKTSFQLVRFSDVRIDPHRKRVSERRETCWTDQQRKAAEREAKLEAARKRRQEKIIEKERARKGGG